MTQAVLVLSTDDLRAIVQEAVRSSAADPARDDDVLTREQAAMAMARGWGERERSNSDG